MSMDNNGNGVALWGMSFSGKTWLIEAFCKWVELNNQKSRDFQIEFVDKDTNKSIDLTDGPSKEGSEQISYKRYLFKRRGLTDGSKYQINSHCHEIAIIDVKGDDVVGLTSEQSVSSQELRRQKAALSLLKQSPYIVAVIEPGNSKDTDHEDYLDRLKTFRQVLKGKPRYIAMCLTKADKYGEDGMEDVEHVQPLIEIRFDHDKSDEIFEELKKFKTEDGHELKFFSMTAAGYYFDNDGKKKANFEELVDNPLMGWLKKLEDWNPEGVEKPFFWLFDIFEKQKFTSQPVPKWRFAIKLRLNNWRKRIHAKEIYTYKCMMDDLQNPPVVNDDPGNKVDKQPWLTN